MLNPLSETEAAQPLVPPKPDQNLVTAVKGGSLVFIGGIFQNGTRFLFGVLLARLLGADQLGLYNLTLTAAEFATGLAILGLDVATVRYVALYAGRRDEKGVWGVIQVALGGTIALTLLIGIGLYFLADVVAVQLFNEPQLAPLLRLAALLVPLLGLNDILAAATRGFKKMHHTLIAQNMFQPLLRLVLIAFIAVLVGLTPKWGLVTYILVNLASCILFFYFLHRLFSLKRSVGAVSHYLKEMLNFSLPVYLSNLINNLSGNIQLVLLGSFGSMANVGIFAVATQINIVGKLFYGAFATSLTPIIAELHDRGERERMASLYQTTTKWIFTVNLPLFLIIMMFPVPILLIFGESFVRGASVLVILAWAHLVNVGTGICGTMLDMTGNTRLKLLNTVVTVGATVGLNALLIPRWGLYGAAIAALVAAVIVNSLRVVEVFILYRMLPYNLKFVKPIAAGLLALAVVQGMRLLQGPENIFYIAVDILVLIMVYGSGVLLLGLSTEDRMILGRVGQRLKGMRFKSGG